MPVIINLDEIKDGKTEFTGKESASILEMGNEKNFRFKGPIGYNLTVYAATDQLVVKGDLSIDMSCRCIKCLDFFSLKVREQSFKCVRKLTDELEFVDLTDDIRQAILLAFPSYPICSPDCKGLCPYCGINLNKEHCFCKPPADTRWKELDNLKVKQ